MKSTTGLKSLMEVIISPTCNSGRIFEPRLSGVILPILMRLLSGLSSNEGI